MAVLSAIYKFRVSSQTITTGTRILLLFLFTYTVVSKLMDIPLYTLTMELQPFPLPVSRFLVWAVPAGEGLTCLLLLFDRTAARGFGLALVLLGSFTVYSALAASGFYSKVPCPCGGMIRGLTWTEHLIMNLFFLAAAAVGLRYSADGPASRTILRNQEKPNTCINQ